MLPLSPAWAYSLLCPSIVTASSGNRACMPNTLPVRFWQARQWQMDTRTGSPRVWMMRFPQRQVAWRLVMEDPRGFEQHPSRRIRRWICRGMIASAILGDSIVE
jgi:hypothetical protein